jgi:hypothetical protein
MVLLLVRQLLQLLQTYRCNAVANVDALYAAIPVEVLDAEDMAIYMVVITLEYTTALKMLICSITMLIQLMEIVVPGTSQSYRFEWFKCFKTSNCG